LRAAAFLAFFAIGIGVLSKRQVGVYVARSA